MLCRPILSQNSNLVACECSDIQLKTLVANVISWATVAITFGLPLLLFVFAVTCNDSTGCPVPSLVQSKRFSWETLQVETGWRDGIWSFPRLGVSIVVLAYYMLNMALWRMLPAQEMYGTKLVHHDRPLKYRLNGK